jgi:hypothetical protein
VAKILEAHMRSQRANRIRHPNARTALQTRFSEKPKEKNNFLIVGGYSKDEGMDQPTMAPNFWRKSDRLCLHHPMVNRFPGLYSVANDVFFLSFFNKMGRF